MSFVIESRPAISSPCLRGGGLSAVRFEGREREEGRGEEKKESRARLFDFLIR